MNDETPVIAPEAPPKKPAGKRHRKGHPIRNTIITVVVLAILGVGGYFLWQFLTQEEEQNAEIQTATAMWGSIQSSVQGSGSARSKESAAITLQNSGIVQHVYVTEGQLVMEGEPLYEIVSPAAQEALNMAVKDVEKAQENVQKQYDELDRLQSALLVLKQEYQDLLSARQQAGLDRYVRAPFAGQLQDTVNLPVGAAVSKGTRLATLVDDSKFRVSFYFSYAYEGLIRVGQPVSLTVGSISADLTGTVDEVNMVRRVSPEGATLFEVQVVVPNPGALTKGQEATAALTGDDGTPIYPYDAGVLDYYRTAEVVAKTTGEVVSTSLRDYADVTQGQVLLTLSEEDFSTRLEAKNDQIAVAQDTLKNQEQVIETAQTAVTAAEEKVASAQLAISDFSAVAPISGTVTYCSLMEGQEVQNGETVITISNNTTMIVSITVDDRNIAFVKPGMGVQLQSGWGGGSFYGVVTKIDMTLSGGAMGTGMTNYPVTLEVDNWDGSLLDGMWLSYSFVTSQSDNCITVPMSSVKYISLEDGSTAPVVFILADERPGNAVDVAENSGGGYYYSSTPQYPSEEDGYYAVPVTTGLTDNYNVEITDGLQGGETVFVSYIMTQAWG